MFFRVLFIIAGLLIIYAGFDVIKNEAFYYFGNYIHLGRAKLSVGIAIIIFGLLMIFLAIRRGFSYNGDKFVKCVKCLEVYSLNSLPDRICPKCMIEVEDLEGFFERNPDLTNEDDSKIK